MDLETEEGALKRILGLLEGLRMGRWVIHAGGGGLDEDRLSWFLDEVGDGGGSEEGLVVLVEKSDFSLSLLRSFLSCLVISWYFSMSLAMASSDLDLDVYVFFLDPLGGMFSNWKERIHPCCSVSYTFSWILLKSVLSHKLDSIACSI